MNIVIIDGQGGRLGKTLVEAVLARFPCGIKTRNVALPILIYHNSAVAMLGAHCYFKIFIIQIDFVIGVQLNRSKIHFLKTLNGRAKQSTRALKI